MKSISRMQKMMGSHEGQLHEGLGADPMPIFQECVATIEPCLGHQESAENIENGFHEKSEAAPRSSGHEPKYIIAILPRVFSLAKRAYLIPACGIRKKSGDYA